MIFTRLLLTVTVAALTTPALAHTGTHSFSGFLPGFHHPLSGLDHMLAMVGVGLFAASLGGRALWAVPTSFLLTMLMGGALGLTGVEIPAVEAGIAMSVITLGVVMTLGWSWPVTAAMGFVGVFAVFHGLAHGSEIPSGADAAFYSLGFTAASAILHILGIGMSCMAQNHSRAIRSVGAAMTVVGLVLALG